MSETPSSMRGSRPWATPAHAKAGEARLRPQRKRAENPKLHFYNKPKNLQQKPARDIAYLVEKNRFELRE